MRAGLGYGLTPLLTFPAPVCILEHMTNIFLWSDTHILHKKVAELRGFDSVEEHDEYIRDSWNSKVRKNDQVILLGDLSMGSVENTLHFFQSLPGTKDLIPGNHDAVHPMHRRSHRVFRRYLSTFRSIQAFDRRKFSGVEFNLSHFPYAGDHDGLVERHMDFRLRQSDVPLLHGHVHSEWKHRGNQINLGVEHWKDGPVPIEDVLSLWNSIKDEGD